LSYAQEIVFELWNIIHLMDNMVDSIQKLLDTSLSNHIHSTIVSQFN
jgi:hypothetical protein